MKDFRGSNQHFCYNIYTLKRLRSFWFIEYHVFNFLSMVEYKYNAAGYAYVLTNNYYVYMTGLFGAIRRPTQVRVIKKKLLKI